MNFLKETIEDIAESGHQPTDIVFIGSALSGHCCTWAEFCVLADFEYDNGHGAQEVAEDLIVVFSDGNTMWRVEYDGSEDWEYGRPFTAGGAPQTIKRLAVSKSEIGWMTLAALNK